MSKTEDLIERCKNNNIIFDATQRWEQGTEHHPEALQIFEMVQSGDFAFCNDYFDWRSGGDGDNGETFLYSLSIMLELRDAERNKQ